MLRILGSPKRCCDGLTRREMLSAGGLGLFGLSLGEFLGARGFLREVERLPDGA